MSDQTVCPVTGLSQDVAAVSAPVLSLVFEVPITFRLAEGAEGQALHAALEVRWGLAVSPLLKMMGKKSRATKVFVSWVKANCYPQPSTR